MRDKVKVNLKMDEKSDVRKKRRRWEKFSRLSCTCELGKYQCAYNLNLHKRVKIGGENCVENFSNLTKK
jgi:hypothetical protein